MSIGMPRSFKLENVGAGGAGAPAMGTTTNWVALELKLYDSWQQHIVLVLYF
jgi:hypothetical protein